MAELEQLNGTLNIAMTPSDKSDMDFLNRAKYVSERLQRGLYDRHPATDGKDKSIRSQTS